MTLKRMRTPMHPDDTIEMFDGCAGKPVTIDGVQVGVMVGVDAETREVLMDVDAHACDLATASWPRITGKIIP